MVYQKRYTWLRVSIKLSKNNNTAEPSIPFLMHKEKCTTFIENNINITTYMWKENLQPVPFNNK